MVNSTALPAPPVRLVPGNGDTRCGHRRRRAPARPAAEPYTGPPALSRRNDSVTYVIAEPCVDLKDKACIEECPVDCIYEGQRSLYIHPDECVDCGACEPVCPVEAIFYEDDTPGGVEGLLQGERRVLRRARFARWCQQARPDRAGPPLHRRAAAAEPRRVTHAESGTARASVPYGPVAVRDRGVPCPAGEPAAGSAVRAADRLARESEPPVSARLRPPPRLPLGQAGAVQGDGRGPRRTASWTSPSARPSTRSPS